MIFTIAVGSRRGEVMGVPFIEFLAPGILMMTVTACRMTRMLFPLIRPSGWIPMVMAF